MTTPTSLSKGQADKKDKSTWRAKGHTQPVKRQPGEVPMLYLHKGSQFHVFMDAISKAAMKEYGHSAKMFETKVKYVPSLPNKALFAFLTDPDDFKAAWTEAIKSYTKEMLNVDTQAPKMYGFIWKYLSVGSVEEIKQHKDFATFSVDKDPVALWKAIVETHPVDGVSKVPAIMKSDARGVYQSCKQGGFEWLVTYRERFDAAHKSQEVAGNVAVKAEDQAMDFFNGLDPIRYAEFRTTINNQMELNSTITLPTVNRVYELAGKWVKSVPVHGRQGNATTYVTTNLDYIPPPAKVTPEKPQPDSEPKVSDVLVTAAANNKTEEGGKSRAKVKCFKCGIFGHYANKCPERQQEASEELDQDDQLHTLNATWEASTFLLWSRTYTLIWPARFRLFAPNFLVLRLTWVVHGTLWRKLTPRYAD